MSVFGSIRGRASSIRLTPQDIELSPKPRQDERPPRRRPLYTVIPGESDPIIAQFIADMIEFITPYDELIPALYQTYTPTVYDNDDEDRLISPLQRLWIRRCILLEEYDYLSSFEMRCCLHQNFQEQTLKDVRALQEINILVLVDYFKTLARETQHEFAPRTELELVSIHYRALRGHMFDVPVALSFTRERSSNDSSTSGSSSNRSSTGDVHASGLINESRLAIAPLLPGHLLPIRSRVEEPRGGAGNLDYFPDKSLDEITTQPPPC
ncbi:U3 small nucleolar ribonucleoprotein [Venturia nashicola]|uniref:U3 small nucleolar ribonucleoprotein n=1 Tax=Venturia nashicola TaxID=86259 RepID=A0A4Z1NY88_9PEZI|nr:U3 small nucleolar ribonucleoprotein [Venturia nashicola]